MASESMKKQPPKSPKPKRPRGRPQTRIIKLDATPEEVAQAIFKAAEQLKS